MKIGPSEFKLLQVTSGDLWAGAEVQFYYLCRQLFERGIDVHVVLFNEGILATRLRQAGLPIFVFDEASLSGAQLFKAFVTHLRRLQPDIIHTHGHKENVLVSFANALSIRTCSVRTVHGASEIHEPLWKVHKHIIHWLNVFTGRYLQQAIISVSFPLAQILRPVYGSSKVHVIENAIDVAYVEELSRRASEHVVEHSHFNIAVIGRLVRVKRQDLVLEAVAKLIVKNPHIRVYVIGDGPLRVDLEQLASQLKLQDVAIFTGALDPVYPILAQMDLLIMPSDHEGLPMTLLEAMALHVPITAHAVGGILCATQNGALAELVENHTVAGYSSAIELAVNCSELCKLRADKAYEHVKESYDIGKKYLDYLALYSALLKMELMTSA